MIGCDEEEIAEGVSILDTLFARYVTMLDNEHHRKAIERKNPIKSTQTLTANNPKDPTRPIPVPRIPLSKPLFINEPAPLSEENKILAALLPPPVE